MSKKTLKDLGVAVSIPKKYQGRSAHRYKDNPDEKRFARVWADKQEHGRVLAYLLNDGGDGRHPPIDPTPEQHLTAATVVQWLGSPVGQSFLADYGYKKLEEK